MRKLASVLCLGAVSTASVAQMASTNCTSMGGMTHCDTIGGGNSGAVVNNYGDDHSLEVLASVIHNASEASVRSKIGKMVAAGQCEEARSYALQKGRLELASAVTRLCQARSAAAPTTMALQSVQTPQPGGAPSTWSGQGVTANAPPPLSPYQQGRLLAARQLEEAAELSGSRKP
jgi:hypothetical protein